MCTGIKNDSIEQTIAEQISAGAAAGWEGRPPQNPLHYQPECNRCDIRQHAYRLGWITGNAVRLEGIQTLQERCTALLDEYRAALTGEGQQ